ncbi:Exportin-7-like protein [Drosera capensis]
MVSIHHPFPPLFFLLLLLSNYASQNHHEKPATNKSNRFTSSHPSSDSDSPRVLIWRQSHRQMESLAQLEAMCERLYNSQDSSERAMAENTLRCFSVNAEYIPQCQYILDNALTPYALMLASSSLLKQVTEHSLPLQLRLDIRNYLINYLATRGPELQHFVIQSLIQLLCRLTKFGWLHDDKFRDVVTESMSFLTQATPQHYAIGLKILNQLVTEMNQVLVLTF